MGHRILKAAAGAAALLGLGVGVANAAISPAAGPAWRSVGPRGAAGAITAVTTLQHAGKVAEFAFAYNGNKPSLYARSNNESWAHDPVPVAKAGERIVSAKAVALNEVLAFTDIQGGGSRVLQVVGHSAAQGGAHSTWYTWKVLKSFGGEIGNASVLSASNVWVFGDIPSGPARLGVWHYNGKAWTQLSKTFTNGAGVSGTTAWAASGTTLEHYSGGKWTAASIAGLLSSKTAMVSTIFPGANSGSPYAIVTENEKDGHVGAPVVLLEYNRHAWVKVATYAFGSAVPGVAAADGHDGLWFPVNAGPGEPARLLHFSNAHRTLTVTALPGLTDDRAGSSISSIAQIGGYTKELAGGDSMTPAGKLIAKIYYLS
jgi:hypothetical protein